LTRTRTDSRHTRTDSRHTRTDELTCFPHAGSEKSRAISMALATDAVCRANEAQWTTLPAFTSEVALARTHIASIRQDG